jgi:hypothetical protein
MKLFKKSKITNKIPDGFSAEDIKIEASICTGEKTIGFYDDNTKRLCCAELVRNDEDIAAFYDKYGIEYSGRE